MEFGDIQPIYTYGRKVNVVSDHKPLECILGKALANAPKRLQGMMMRLQKYDADLIYVPGKNPHLADTLSRAYRPTAEELQRDFEHLHDAGYVRPHNLIPDLKRYIATEADQGMTALKQGWPDEGLQLPTLVHPHFSMRD